MEVKEGKEVITQERCVNIIYFLSRMGRIEHPHLIRVHHSKRNGVYLRDVKKWLSDIRGEDMANSFTWSYKRRYKNGFIWQDLVEDEPITPTSDNEYVLKGTEIISRISSTDACVCCGKKASAENSGRNDTVNPQKQMQVMKKVFQMEIEDDAFEWEMSATTTRVEEYYSSTKLNAKKPNKDETNKSEKKNKKKRVNLNTSRDLELEPPTTSSMMTAATFSKSPSHSSTGTSPVFLQYFYDGRA